MKVQKIQRMIDFMNPTRIRGACLPSFPASLPRRAQTIHSFRSATRESRRRRARPLLLSLRPPRSPRSLLFRRSFPHHRSRATKNIQLSSDLDRPDQMPAQILRHEAACQVPKIEVNIKSTCFCCWSVRTLGCLCEWEPNVWSSSLPP